MSTQKTEKLSSSNEDKNLVPATPNNQETQEEVSDDYDAIMMAIDESEFIPKASTSIQQDVIVKDRKKDEIQKHAGQQQKVSVPSDHQQRTCYDDDHPTSSKITSRKLPQVSDNTKTINKKESLPVIPPSTQPSLPPLITTGAPSSLTIPKPILEDPPINIHPVFIESDKNLEFKIHKNKPNDPQTKSLKKVGSKIKQTTLNFNVKKSDNVTKIETVSALKIHESTWQTLRNAVGFTTFYKPIMEGASNQQHQQQLKKQPVITIQWIQENAAKTSKSIKIPLILIAVAKNLITGGNCIMITDSTGSMKAILDDDYLSVFKQHTLVGTCMALKNPTVNFESGSATIRISEQNVICIASTNEFTQNDLRLPTWNDMIFMKKKNHDGVSLLQFSNIILDDEFLKIEDLLQSFEHQPTVIINNVLEPTTVSDDQPQHAVNMPILKKPPSKKRKKKSTKSASASTITIQKSRPISKKTKQGDTEISTKLKDTNTSTLTQSKDVSYNNAPSTSSTSSHLNLPTSEMGVTEPIIVPPSHFLNRSKISKSENETAKLLHIREAITDADNPSQIKSNIQELASNLPTSETDKIDDNNMFDDDESDEFWINAYKSQDD